MKKEINDTAEALSQAFINDPLFNAFFPQATPHCMLSYYTFRFLIRHTKDHGEITLARTHNKIVGAALWLPSESANRSILDEIYYGGINMLRQQGFRSILRQMNASQQMSIKHKTLLASPHYYLSILGLKPEAQGQGLATQLISPILERADNEAKPCYLDTHNEKNIQLYQRYGFEVVNQDVINKTSVKHWVMIRPPK